MNTLAFKRTLKNIYFWFCVALIMSIMYLLDNIYAIMIGSFSIGALFGIWVSVEEKRL